MGSSISPWPSRLRTRRTNALEDGYANQSADVATHRSAPGGETMTRTIGLNRVAPETMTMIGETIHPKEETTMIATPGQAAAVSDRPVNVAGTNHATQTLTGNPGIFHSDYRYDSVTAGYNL